MGSDRLLHNRQAVSATAAAYHGRGYEHLADGPIWTPPSTSCRKIWPAYKYLRLEEHLFSFVPRSSLSVFFFGQVAHFPSLFTLRSFVQSPPRQALHLCAKKYVSICFVRYILILSQQTQISSLNDKPISSCLLNLLLPSLLLFPLFRPVLLPPLLLPAPLSSVWRHFLLRSRFKGI